MAIPLDVDAVDSDLDEILAVAAHPLRVVLAALLLEYDDLFAAILAVDRAGHRVAGDQRETDLRLVAADHQHLAERDLRIFGARQSITLDSHDVTLGDAILLSTGLDDGVHNDLREMEPRFLTHGSWIRQRARPRIDSGVLGE